MAKINYSYEQLKIDLKAAKDTGKFTSEFNIIFGFCNINTTKYDDKNFDRLVERLSTNQYVGTTTKNNKPVPFVEIVKKVATDIGVSKKDIDDCKDMYDLCGEILTKSLSKFVHRFYRPKTEDEVKEIENTQCENGLPIHNLILGVAELNEDQIPIQTDRKNVNIPTPLSTAVQIYDQEETSLVIPTILAIAKLCALMNYHK